MDPCRGGRVVWLVLGLLTTALCDFGPLTSIEVRALGTLAAAASSRSTPIASPRERSPRPERVLRERCPSRELPTASKTAQLSSSTGLRGGTGAAFVQGSVLPLSPGCSHVGGFRRSSSAQEFVHRRLEISERDLEHRAVSLRRQRSVDNDPVCRFASSGLQASPATSGPEKLLATQGAMHHLKVIASAARNARWGRLTAVTMSAVPGGEIPADSSLQYPAVSSKENIISVVSGACATATFLFLDSSIFVSSWLRLSAFGLFYFVAGSLAGSVLLSEKRIQPYLRSEREAAYVDSNFMKAGAVTAHYLEALPSTGSPRLTLVCLHGFGASCSSYRLVLQPLADALQARVLALDMPGFGLTSRPKKIRDFCPQQMLSHFVDALGLSESQSKVPLVVMGHSLGGLVTSKFVTAHDSVAAAVLVAPLVVHPGSDALEKRAGESIGARALLRRRSARYVLANVCKTAWGVTGALLKYGFQALVKLLVPVFGLLLRRMVYSPGFWPQALGGTYYDRGRLQDEVVAGYRRGSWVRGWEAGLLNFVRYRLTAGRSLWEMLTHACSAIWGQEPAAASTFAALRSAAATKPVLFIHGIADKVIPCANSRVVSGVLGGRTEYVEMDVCGHCPQEERPDEFVRTVAGYLRRTLARVYA